MQQFCPLCKKITEMEFVDDINEIQRLSDADTPKRTVTVICKDGNHRLDYKLSKSYKLDREY